ncbi:MAG: NAD-dependent epimerase/dehydratase family protein [Pseudomonadota bacterium]|nr:NAD-dependent epimerase/dehydratase family protein [Pseudomonadota bacterium]MEC8530438.1 NAD-dependent epimerase/dehydratase family protein [Pseudomonadota bacterium]|tara:strand:- start:202 stop:1182 length:981 start_codon:yes stop_codon:yes gene_type:complete
MKTLVTGVAGFIGFHTAIRLLDRGGEVVGIDSVNDYYSVSLKRARLEKLLARDGFSFHKLDLSDRNTYAKTETAIKGVTRTVHLAAQAGVRHSIDHPFDYVDSNLVAHLTILELCRHQPNFEHLVFASSSSVYGGNRKLPFSIEDRTDSPISLYAATKRANEHMSYSYAHLYGLPQTGLRFFTVYGPWGRPDMALYIFADSIINSRPIEVFNHGEMKRDFTFIDDIVTGVVAAHDNPPARADGPPYKIYNIGNNRSEPLMRLIGVLEGALGRKAEIVQRPMQMGDVKESFADIDAIQTDLGFEPTTSIDVGVPKFVEWFKSYNGYD